MVALSSNVARRRYSTTSAAAVASAVAACRLNASVSLAPCARQAEDAVEVGAAFAEHDAAREALHAGGGQIDRVHNDQRETNKLDGLAWRLSVRAGSLGRRDYIKRYGGSGLARD